MSLEYRISLKPTASEVTRFNAWLDEKFAQSRLEKSLAADLKLCLNEVMANLISYGFAGTVEPLALVEIRLRPGYASATVADNGVYFDIREFNSSKARDLMNGDPGGFGIALIKERASRINYQRDGGLNRLEIVCEASP
ncbi:MAG: ATP-binding protein [Proteobacteria bacterium]|nr:ATP-binding protein [Pseudomonadota bacterium]